MGRRLRSWAPVLVAAAMAVALVVVLQIHGRGWLAYDEAARVEPGSTPLEMRLAAGAFTEPVAICVDLSLL